MKKTLSFLIAAMLLLTLSAAGATAVSGTAAVAGMAEVANVTAQPTLTYIGHAHLMIITAEGTVIYIDPMPLGYTYEHNADIILASHEHGDHNYVEGVPQNDDCVILRVDQTINGDGTYNTFTIGEVTVIPVPAQNKNHGIKENNGFVILFDGFAVYHAVDTDKLDSMADLQQYNIDYAFFPIDGVFNMGAAEAMECAVLVGAKHNTPIHWFDADPSAFTPENLLLMNNLETITLEKSGV